jgi:ribosomal protein S4
MLARYTSSTCRLCRRENLKLFVKGVKTLPTREDITLPIQEKLIVELYSK